MRSLPQQSESSRLYGNDTCHFLALVRGKIISSDRIRSTRFPLCLDLYKPGDSRFIILSSILVGKLLFGKYGKEQFADVCNNLYYYTPLFVVSHFRLSAKFRLGRLRSGHDFDIFPELLAVVLHGIFTKRLERVVVLARL